MPVVPRRGLGYTPTTQTPTVNPAGAFTPPAPVNIGPAAQELARQTEEHQQGVDNMALLDADNQLSSLSTGLQQQVLSKQGKDAIGAGADVQDAWTKAVSQIGGGVNNRIQDQFRARADHHFSVLNETVQNHARVETQKFDTETTDAFLQNRLNDALTHYTDPLTIGQSLAESKDVLDTYAARNGWSSEQLQEKRTNVVSKIHTGVIDRMLTDGNDITAQSYFNAHKDELNANDQLQVGHALDIGSLRGESQRRADSIVSSSATLGGALQEAAKITNPDGTPNPKLREETEGRIRRYFEDQSASDRFGRQKAYEEASAILAQNPDLHAIPPSMMQKLSASEQIELQHLVNAKRNPERPTDWPTYARLLNMAGLNDSTRSDFEQLDLTKYRGVLADAQYSHLLTLQLGERRQTTGELSSEAKRQAGIAARDQAKEAARLKSIQTLRDMGVEIPEPARVPGAPLRQPIVQLKASPKGKQVPQSWIDKASKDENYKRYLQHMGVVFDSAASTPSVRPSARDTGDITLR